MDFQNIYKDYKSRIFRYTFNYTKDRLEQDELVQDIFFNVFISLKDFKGKSSLSTYIYSIARNVCLKYVKSNIRERKKVDRLIRWQQFEYENSPEELYELSENAKFFLSVVDKLKEEYKEVYILSEVEKLRYQEISAILGIPIGTVKSRLNRAKEKIVTLLNNIDEGGK